MYRRTITALGGVGLLFAAACGTTGPSGTTMDSPSPTVLEQAARADSVRRSYTQADVDFMVGMIHHHAQAVVMSRMAPTHGASPSLQTLARRIINAQKDEIALMQRWLRERDEPVPMDGDDGRMHTAGDAGHHAGREPAAADAPDAMPMAGMLTPEQLARLDAARGADWDRLFLTYMIQHHQGALTMVDELFASYGAGQGDEIFKIASDIGADQASEIDRMQRMLEALLFDSDGLL